MNNNYVLCRPQYNDNLQEVFLECFRYEANGVSAVDVYNTVDYIYELVRNGPQWDNKFLVWQAYRRWYYGYQNNSPLGLQFRNLSYQERVDYSRGCKSFILRLENPYRFSYMRLEDDGWDEILTVTARDQDDADQLDYIAGEFLVRHPAYFVHSI
jgi:hypothetical protein